MLAISKAKEMIQAYKVSVDQIPMDSFYRRFSPDNIPLRKYEEEIEKLKLAIE